MKLTNFMVDHPCKCMCCGYLVLIVLTVIFFMGEMYKVSMDGRRDYLAEYDPIVIDWDMIGLASKVVQPDEKEVEEGVRTKPDFFGLVQCVYEYTGDSEYGLLEKSALLKIQKFEKAVQKLPLWTSVCLAQAGDDPSCQVLKVDTGMLLLQARCRRDPNADPKCKELAQMKESPIKFGAV